MKYLLVGVNGAGKTTLLKAIKKLKPEFEAIRGSHELMKSMGIPGDYDALRATPVDVAHKYFEALLKQILEKKADLILDCHVLNLVKGDIRDVSSPFMGEFDALLFLKTSPEIILHRIASENRDRDLFFGTANVEDKQSVFTDYAHQYEVKTAGLAKKYNIPLKIFDGDRSPEENADAFLTFDASLRVRR